MEVDIDSLKLDWDKLHELRNEPNGSLDPKRSDEKVGVTLQQRFGPGPIDDPCSNCFDIARRRVDDGSMSSEKAICDIHEAENGAIGVEREPFHSVGPLGTNGCSENISDPDATMIPLSVMNFKDDMKKAKKTVVLTGRRTCPTCGGSRKFWCALMLLRKITVRLSKKTLITLYYLTCL